MAVGFRACFLLLIMALPMAVLAEEPVAMPVPQVGVVDVEQVLREALAAKAVVAQAAKYRQEFQQQSAAEESALRTTQQAIEQQRKTLSPQEYSDKARAFDASVADYQRKESARRRAFEKSSNIAMSKVQQAMVEATGKIAETHHINLVFPTAQILLFDPKMNMTREIIALMDKALPSVEFPPPQLESDNQPPTAPPAPVVKKKN